MEINGNIWKCSKIYKQQMVMRKLFIFFHTPDSQLPSEEPEPVSLSHLLKILGLKIQ